MNRATAAAAAACLALLALAAAGPAAAQDDPRPDYSHLRWESYREAQSRARSEDKPLMIQFYAPWSRETKKMERGAWQDPAVIRYLNDHFALTRVDIDKLPALARKYDVEGLPTLWFLDAQGKRLTHLDGHIGADGLLPLLEFIVAKDYEWTDYETWRQRRHK